jgi:hypothetical protein
MVSDSGRNFKKIFSPKSVDPLNTAGKIVSGIQRAGCALALGLPMI